MLFRSRDTPRQDILPALTTGLLSDTPSSARGSLFPQPRLADGAGSVLMDHRFGHGWRLVLSPTAALPITPTDLTVIALTRPSTPAPGMAPSQFVGVGWGGGAAAPDGELASFDPHPSLPPARGKEQVATERDAVVAAWMDHHACTAALVRPDHYVFGTANDDASLSALLAESQAALSYPIGDAHATT